MTSSKRSTSSPSQSPQAAFNTSLAQPGNVEVSSRHSTVVESTVPLSSSPVKQVESSQSAPRPNFEETLSRFKAQAGLRVLDRAGAMEEGKPVPRYLLPPTSLPGSRPLPAKPLLSELATRWLEQQGERSGVLPAEVQSSSGLGATESPLLPSLAGADVSAGTLHSPLAERLPAQMAAATQPAPQLPESLGNTTVESRRADHRSTFEENLRRFNAQAPVTVPRHLLPNSTTQQHTRPLLTELVDRVLQQQRGGSGATPGELGAHSRPSEAQSSLPSPSNANSRAGDLRSSSPLEHARAAEIEAAEQALEAPIAPFANDPHFILSGPGAKAFRARSFVDAVMRTDGMKAKAAILEAGLQTQAATIGEVEKLDAAKTAELDALHRQVQASTQAMNKEITAMRRAIKDLQAKRSTVLKEYETTKADHQQESQAIELSLNGDITKARPGPSTLR